MDSVPGQTFLNYAYSWGAAIVILGALFKLTHIEGGNIMLFIGMGTEVVVFFLSAFDRPFDKNEIGKELAADIETDDEIAESMDREDGIYDEEDEAYGEDEAYAGEDEDYEENQDETFEEERGAVVAEGVASVVGAGATPVIGGTQAVQGGTIIIGGGAAPQNVGVVGAPAVAASVDDQTQQVAAAAIAENTPVGEQPFQAEAQRLAQIIRVANDELLHRAQAVLSPEMETATQTYIEKLNTLAETFAKVDEQSARLAKDSEEMENLNRTLTGINKVYELHLKSISLQVGTIDQINEQTHKLAQQIEELNAVYGRMIEALTVNMRGGNGSSNV